MWQFRFLQSFPSVRRSASFFWPMHSFTHSHLVGINKMSTTARYVPLGAVSLSTDAPGYEAPRSRNDGGKEVGPVCWKCKGNGRCKPKKLQGAKRKRPAIGETTASPPPSQALRSCPVCSGSGHLPPKAVSSQEGSKGLPGMITASRRRAPISAALVVQGPDAIVMGRMKTVLSEDNAASSIPEGELQSLTLLQKACLITNLDAETKVAGVEVPTSDDNYPSWMPANPGEQLCNLVGNWRILQRVGSHRWTTDDIVTAYVASRVCLGLPMPGQRQQVAANAERKEHLRYLDLGTGNASVLQMTCWALWEQYGRIDARGIEARAEAIGLARRSLSFNVGPAALRGEETDLHMEKSIGIVRSDFRGLSQRIASNSSKLLQAIRSTKFDLVSGTPPYFEISFESSDDKASGVQSTIVQGGMPTSKQSAPARCEFRGGVEAYCAAAASVLSPNGNFVVCVNWANNQRVYDGAAEAGLHVVTALPVKGKKGKKEPLFGVYVLRKICSGNEGGAPSQETEVLSSLTVRNQNGEWTDEYERVMADMGIPRCP